MCTYEVKRQSVEKKLRIRLLKGMSKRRKEVKDKMNEKEWPKYKQENCKEETDRECDKYIESKVKDMMHKRSGKKHVEKA